MNSIVRLILYFFALFGLGNMAMQPALAQQPSPDPIVSLSVKDEALVSALETIASQTGYQFDLTPKWEKHMVSATIDHQPLEQVLKRLLRSLNYTILWEADKVVVIKVYGKADASTSSGISFAAPPQEILEEELTPIESDDESLEEEGEEDDEAEAEADEADEKEQPDLQDKPGPKGKNPAIKKPAAVGRLIDSKRNE